MIQTIRRSKRCKLYRGRHITAQNFAALLCITPTVKIISSAIMIYAIVYRVGQFSMVWDFMGRRPLTVRDLAITFPKFGGSYSDGFISIKIQSLNRYFAKQRVAKLWKYNGSNHGSYLMKPHGLWSAEVSGP